MNALSGACPMMADAVLTPPALTALLRDAAMLAGGEVTAIRREQIGVGMAGSCLRLHLRLTEGAAGPASLIAKLPASTKESRDAGASHQLYVREVEFFRHLAHRIAMRVPRPVHADCRVEENDFVVLLEDMSPSEMGDQLAGCDPSRAATAMEEAAALHAPLWGQDVLAAYPWLDQSQVIVPMVSAAYPMLHAAFLDRYTSRLSAEAREMTETLAGFFVRSMTSTPRVACLQHGDFRLDNIMFDVRGGREPMATLDWQTVTAGAGAADVAYFIGTSLTPAQQTAHARDLVARWHAALLRRGVQGYSADDAWEDVRRYATGGLSMAVIASSMVTPTARGDDMFLAMATRAAAFARALDTAALWQ